jgi:hypothetical protein
MRVISAVFHVNHLRFSISKITIQSQRRNSFLPIERNRQGPGRIRLPLRVDSLLMSARQKEVEQIHLGDDMPVKDGNGARNALRVITLPLYLLVLVRRSLLL